MKEEESCGICGGDGRIGNSFAGSTTRCPACHGTGRRSEGGGLRDVTKTKPSHHRKPAAPAQVPAKPTWPQTLDGSKLANEVQASATVSDETKALLIRRILDFEASHGSCTQTFLKKVRKQLRASAQ
jgi:hypothetical protein